jgi:hypothetical protein
VHRKNLPVGVAQEVASDPARPDFRPLGRGLILYSVEVCRTAQHVVIFKFVHREVFRPALDRSIASGAEKAWHLEQSRYVLLIVPTVELGLEFGVDVGPHH